MKSTKQFKGRCGSIARVVSMMSFLLLTIIGVSSLVNAMTLNVIANKNGIPLSWDTASIGNTSSITVPMTYFDQRQDDCNAPNRQFEWTDCGYTKYLGLQQGIVQDTLGSDGLPAPKYTTSAAAKAGGLYPVSTNLTGHNPAQPGDNFYRWFHEVTDASGKQLSKRIDREAVFTRTGESTYTFGGADFFPLNDVSFSKSDPINIQYGGRNYHFTAHMQLPVKVDADGTERFDFVGDDDVWVYLNDQLVLDIGGYHGQIDGWFQINANGTITSYVNGAGTKVIASNFQPGDVVNLDFFFAERSSGGSNCTITMRNMNWPISASSDIQNTIAGKIESSESNLIQNISSITNRDTVNVMTVEKISAYIREIENITDIYDRVTTKTHEGFLPLSSETLFYSTTPEDAASWKPVNISAPSETSDGFKLAEPIRVAPAGQAGDTVYFRYYTETSEYSGSMNSQISFLTNLNGAAGLAYDYNTVEYTSPKRNEDVIAHKFSFDYLFEDGSVAAPTETRILDPGEAYTVTPPAVNGFTPNISEVQGIAGDKHTNFAVIYSPNDNSDADGSDNADDANYYAKVTYVYEDNKQAKRSGIILASQTNDAETQAQIAVSVNNNLKSGRSYNFISPRVDGYYPSRPAVVGTIDHDNVEETVTYSKQPTMVVPGTIVKPTPDTSASIIDNGLAFLAPLGEVAYVPNTGIIGDAVSAFGNNFVDIVLSQWFILGVLLVFAGSFAIYFSCRKYIAKPTNDAKTVVKNAKNAKEATKPTAKSAKAVAKSTTKAKATKVKTTKPAAKSAAKTKNAKPAQKSKK